MGDGPVANLPPGLGAYAGYVNHSGIGVTWPEVEALAAQQGAEALSITTDGSPMPGWPMSSRERCRTGRGTTSATPR